MPAVLIIRFCRRPRRWCRCESFTMLVVMSWTRGNSSTNDSNCVVREVMIKASEGKFNISWGLFGIRIIRRLTSKDEFRDIMSFWRTVRRKCDLSRTKLWSNDSISDLKIKLNKRKSHQKSNCLASICFARGIFVKNVPATRLEYWPLDDKICRYSDGANEIMAVYSWKYMAGV